MFPEVQKTNVVCLEALTPKPSPLLTVPCVSLWPTVLNEFGSGGALFHKEEKGRAQLTTWDKPPPQMWPRDLGWQFPRTRKDCTWFQKWGKAWASESSRPEIESRFHPFQTKRHPSALLRSRLLICQTAAGVKRENDQGAPLWAANRPRFLPTRLRHTECTQGIPGGPHMACKLI